MILQMKKKRKQEIEEELIKLNTDITERQTPKKSKIIDKCEE